MRSRYDDDDNDEDLTVFSLSFSMHSTVGQAESGDLVAVMGASGCGKSTFLSCLALRDQAFQGNLYMNDAPVDKWYLSLIGK